MGHCYDSSLHLGQEDGNWRKDLYWQIGDAVRTKSELYGEYNNKRCSVPPGITGLAQVQGRLDLSLQERLFWDLQYIDNYSFYEDIKIIYKTIASVISRKGAN